MHEIILDQAEEQHKNDQKQKGTKERFDPSVFEPLPEGSRYVTEISIAPVSMSDFAHCKPTRTSMPPTASICMPRCTLAPQVWGNHGGQNLPGW